MSEILIFRLNGKIGLIYLIFNLFLSFLIYVTLNNHNKKENIYVKNIRKINLLSSLSIIFSLLELYFVSKNITSLINERLFFFLNFFLILLYWSTLHLLHLFIQKKIIKQLYFLLIIGISLIHFYYVKNLQLNEPGDITTQIKYSSIKNELNNFKKNKYCKLIIIDNYHKFTVITNYFINLNTKYRINSNIYIIKKTKNLKKDIENIYNNEDRCQNYLIINLNPYNFGEHNYLKNLRSGFDRKKIKKIKIYILNQCKKNYCFKSV
ncbi:MAG: hypothetical protein QXY79_04680 [Candidatus Methanomethylicia archaeon]